MVAQAITHSPGGGCGGITLFITFTLVLLLSGSSVSFAIARWQWKWFHSRCSSAASGGGAHTSPLRASQTASDTMDAGVSGWVHHLVVDASVKYGNCYASRPFYRLVCVACFLFSVLFFVLSTQQPSTVGRTHHEAIRRTLSLLEPQGPRVDAVDLTVRPFGFDISLQPSAAKSTFRSAAHARLKYIYIFALSAMFCGL